MTREYPVGEDVPLVITVREQRLDSKDGDLYDPLGARIKSIEDEDESAIGASVDLRWIGGGRFIGWWDTSSESTGEYVVKGVVQIANTGEEIPVNERVRLVDA